jgi:N-acetylglucosaminyldiphosphoundecaprenol N-acetyl-beta-D-mannosaminyltransferase
MDESREAIFSLSGIPVFTGSMEEALRFATAGIGTAEPVSMMTIAAWTVIHAMEDAEFLAALRRCRLVLADGWPIVLIIKMRGGRIQGRLAGADFVDEAAAWCLGSARGLVLYGSAEGIAAKAANVLRTRHPGLNVVGITPPFKPTFTEADADAIAGELGAHRPAIVIVGIAVPKGEFLLDRLARRMPGVLLLGVGGGLDNTAGWRARAPKTVQRLYLEWVYRTLQNPKEKVPRIIENLRKFPRVAVSLLREPPGAGGG